MIAVQGVVLASAPIGAVMRRVAFNHYSRTNFENRAMIRTRGWPSAW
jgi:hypothetical protein